MKEISGDNSVQHDTKLSIGSNWYDSELKEKIQINLNRSIKVWHGLEQNFPKKVEVICGEVAKRHGKFLDVRRWLIDPAASGLNECIVAETYLKQQNKYSKDEFVQIHINHLIPADF